VNKNKDRSKSFILFCTLCVCWLGLTTLTFYFFNWVFLTYTNIQIVYKDIEIRTFVFTLIGGMFYAGKAKEIWYEFDFKNWLEENKHWL